jgi:RNase P subunit RPR2
MNLILKEFSCKKCGSIPFGVTFKNKTREEIENYKHVCSWCGGVEVSPTGKEEILIDNEIVTFLNGKEVKRRRRFTKFY